MPEIIEGKLRFRFQNSWTAEKLDDWVYYKNQFQQVCGGSKAVDILAFKHQRCLYLIEVKDYRQFPRTKPSELAGEIAEKVRDSLAMLSAARCNALDHEQTTAEQSLQSKQIQVVLHLEQPRKPSRLNGTVFKPADLIQKLKQLLKAIDPHPKVVSLQEPNNVPWRVEAI